MPCIITVAITGSVPRKEHNPAVPITIAEQVESTQAAFEAGATIAHVHVRKDRDNAKFWLFPEVTVAYNRGFSSREQGELVRVIEQHRDEIESAWHEHFA